MLQCRAGRDGGREGVMGGRFATATQDISNAWQEEMEER